MFSSHAPAPFRLSPVSSYTILLCAVLCVSGEEDDTAEDESFYLRPVAAMDFTMAIKKLKASVDDSGKEIMKVRERERKEGGWE